MAKIFITGSADGLGQLAARKLVENGHQVVLHARNSQRAGYARSKVLAAEDILIADLLYILSRVKIQLQSFVVLLLPEAQEQICFLMVLIEKRI